MTPDPFSSVEAILFDLDGTLADSFEDLQAAVNHVRGRRGLPALPLDAVMACVGHGAGVLLERALGPRDPAVVASDVQAFDAYYSAHLLDRTRPYPGAVEAVAAMAAWRRAVLSNKPERMTRTLVAGLGYAPYLDGAWGGDSFPAMKPDPAAILAALGCLGVSPDRTLMVGDSDVDIEAAARAGVRSVRVRTGLWRGSILVPDAEVEDLRELLARLDSALR